MQAFLKTRVLTAWPAAAALMGVLASCGTDDATASCGPIQREALDSAYLVHVLGTDTAVSYTSDPPTSGPHQPGPPVDGVLDEPLSRPIQVGILERGDVLLQHDPDLDAGDLETLESLAQERVVIAPNPELDDAVVATAWVYKRTCSDVDAEALTEFIEERVGHGPED